MAVPFESWQSLIFHFPQRQAGAICGTLNEEITGRLATDLEVMSGCYYKADCG